MKKSRKCDPLFAKAAATLRLHIPDFRRVALTLVGCGGTGSHLATGLATLMLELRGRGIATDVSFVDPDIVEEKNVGRQLFTRSEVGSPKALVLANRLLSAYGIPVLPCVKEYEALAHNARDDTLCLLIGAVDNSVARATMTQTVQDMEGKCWYLDCGNDHASGQIALGNIAGAKAFKGAVALGMIDRLPAPSLVYPDLVKVPKVKRPIGRDPSCAELTAAGEQSLMINRLVAAWALSLLTDFLVTREVRYFALALDATWGGAKAYVLDVPTLAQVTGVSEKELQGGKQ